MGKLDILNRDDFVNKLLRLMENLSASKASTCFAINGAWGCGKSFVLNLFQASLEQIQSEETYTDKYFVVRYNSWEYDYYEEPLVAIVVTMITAIERKTKFFPESEQTRKILSTLKTIVVALLSVTNDAIKEKTGVDFQKMYSSARSEGRDNAEDNEAKHAYDMYFSFNQMLDKLKELLKEISDNYTIVFIVDELDRCIPEYAVKVLERLHHLNEDQPNIITVMAIDKPQLAASVKRLFGFDNPEKYLEKFISFDIKLDNGSSSDLITKKYADYIALFSNEPFLFDDSVEECMRAIFEGIDIRTQEHLVKKAAVAHKLLYNEQLDYSFMCMELLIAVMVGVHRYQGLFNGATFNCSRFGDVFALGQGGHVPAFAEFFKGKFEQIDFGQGDSFPGEPKGLLLPNKPSLYGALLLSWCWMHSKRTVAIQYSSCGIYTTIRSNCEKLLEFAELLDSMQ